MEIWGKAGMGWESVAVGEREGGNGGQEGQIYLMGYHGHSRPSEGEGGGKRDMTFTHKPKLLHTLTKIFFHCPTRNAFLLIVFIPQGILSKT